MVKDTVLVVDDEDDIVELVRYNLAQAGYEVLTAADGPAAVRLATTHLPSLIVLDLMLPGMNGLDVCRHLKRQEPTADLPIIMLTACGEEADVVAGLELGADDYVTKPFSPRVLLARVRSILRRVDSDHRAEPNDAMVSCHEVQIDPKRFEVLVGGGKVELTSTEFKILHFLARNRGFVYTRSQIVESVHGEDYPVTDRSIDVQIVGLRRKLGDVGEMIETVRGIGYRVRE